MPTSLNPTPIPITTCGDKFMIFAWRFSPIDHHTWFCWPWCTFSHRWSVKRYCWLSVSPLSLYHCSIFWIVWLGQTSIQQIIHPSCWRLNRQAVEKLSLKEFLWYLAVISWGWSGLFTPSTICYTWDFITLPSVLASFFLRWVIGAVINGYTCKIT